MISIQTLLISTLMKYNYDKDLHNMIFFHPMKHLFINQCQKQKVKRDFIFIVKRLRPDKTEVIKIGIQFWNMNRFME
jgi:hypothetical protein